MDGLKIVNDSYGHNSGDIYLNNTYPALALKLKAKGSKVSQVIFYVP